MRTSITGGAVALLIGFVLAAATAYGVVKSQQDAGTSPVSTSNVSYGTN